jgi:diguanylate cyclase (GGDEF)-like protein
MELNKLLEKDCQGWLVFLDLDDFKLINDALGHQAGDAALVAMSKRLLSALGEGALVSRFSGDEFVIFVSAGSGLREDDLLEKLNQLLHQPVSSSGMEFMLSGSLGVVRVPEHGKTVQALLRNADLAMYQAKRQGKNKFFLYTEKLQQELGRKADMATRLKSLVPDEQLSVFFQPRVGLPDRELCGAEALLRWRTPEGDFISPEQFIPVAEETGQILRIGYWVMEQACRWLSGWTVYHDPFVVSINLSPRQLFDERLVERIEALRLRYGLAAAQLEFEITESSAMQDPEYAIKVLLRLRALGYGLSLDDFGTGFSSLSQLRRLPVNVLKIDKSFVQNMVHDRHDRVMVAAIIELATHLELSVLAEGVETVDQLHLLDALGCNEVQGFLVSQPLPAEQFAEEVLINWNRYCRSLAW